MAVAKWQQANGAKKCENGWPKTVRNTQPRKCKNERKSAKAVENKRKQAKTCENDRGVFVDRFLAIFQWSYSGGHLGWEGREEPQSALHCMKCRQFTPYAVAWDVPLTGLTFNLAAAAACFWTCRMLATFRIGYYSKAACSLFAGCGTGSQRLQDDNKK